MDKIGYGKCTLDKPAVIEYEADDDGGSWVFYYHNERVFSASVEHVADNAVVVSFDGSGDAISLPLEQSFRNLLGEYLVDRIMSQPFNIGAEYFLTKML